MGLRGNVSLNPQTWVSTGSRYKSKALEASLLNDDFWAVALPYIREFTDSLN